MYRFVALSWNTSDAARTATAQRLGRLLLSSSGDWQSVLDTPGLRVFHAPHRGGICRAYVLKRDCGVILGKLFNVDSGEGCSLREPTFDERESTLLIQTRGRHLVERYWGHYMAFLRAEDGERRFLLRDPTGALPCFLTNAFGVDVILSDIEDCVRLDLTPLSVDWEHVTAFFVHNRLVTRSTGFREVAQIYAGECVTVSDSPMTVKRSFYWDPVSICEAETIEDPEEARLTLGSTIRHCINAWASCYDSIVHDLSGGLDSSIVAACLAKAKSDTDILCFHHYTEMSEGDERHYARAAARSAGCELIEREVRVAESALSALWNTARVASPAVLGFLPASELLKQRLVAERNAAAVFSGQGGDHLFQQTRSTLIAAEYAHRHGVQPKLLEIITDVSRLTRQSIWSVFGSVLRHGLIRPGFDPYALYCKAPSIVAGDARSSLAQGAYRHPWVENARRLPAGKILHIFHVVDCQPFYLSQRPYAEQIHPLISQPIIERCLQIPTYVLAHRGRERGLVREAFESDIPAKIIHRHSKGGVTSYFNRILVENVAFLRELLLDGVLVKEGILDRRELEQRLSERELIRGKETISIVNAARAETWLSTWADMRQRTAA